MFYTCVQANNRIFNILNLILLISVWTYALRPNFLLQIRNTFFLQILINFGPSNVRSEITFRPRRYFAIYLICILIIYSRSRLLVSLGAFCLIIVHLLHNLIVWAHWSFNSTSLVGLILNYIFICLLHHFPENIFLFPLIMKRIR